MCDSCGNKIGLLSRKQCASCHTYFCSSCVGQPKSPYQCRRCEVFTAPLIERRQLQKLLVRDLKHYLTTRRIDYPLNVTAEELIDLILGHQAHSLAEKTKRALEQLSGHSEANVDIDDLDPSALLPHTSAYSSDLAGQSSVSRYSGAQIRAEVKRKTELAKAFDPTTVTDFSDIQHESQLNELSVRQLKVILQKNCVNYKGCVEKQELLDRVQRLWYARQEEKDTEAKIAETNDTAAENEFMCKVCMDAPVDCVLLECGHMLTCVKCGRQLAECPVCRQYVSRVVHAFKI